MTKPAASRLARVWAALNTERGWSIALVAGPLCFALLSLSYGQDSNWDLRNYHLYNPFALLHGKIGSDLAPGVWQSYFDPTLDLLYYGLATTLSARLAGAIMGALHGLNFVLMTTIALHLLPRSISDSQGARPPYRAALLLSVAGCLGPAFLSEVGNTMGDNMTALCVLGSLLLIARATLQPGGALRAQTVTAGSLLLAGLVMGIGTGLKLTNATYALALCLALFALGGGIVASVRVAWLFGLGVLAGITISAGHWYWRMWTVFGNPLFPQFNDRFQSPMAAPIGIGDTGWLPKTTLESCLWPFLFTLDPKRICEITLRHLMWPLLYIAVIGAALVALRALVLRREQPLRLAPGARLLLVFGVLSYLLWLKLFSIYRYLVPLELVAPLMFFLLLRGWNARIVGRVLVFTALSGVILLRAGDGNWGHGHWTRKSLRRRSPNAGLARAQPIGDGASPVRLASLLLPGFDGRRVARRRLPRVGRLPQPGSVPAGRAQRRLVRTTPRRSSRRCGRQGPQGPRARNPVALCVASRPLQLPPIPCQYGHRPRAVPTLHSPPPEIGSTPSPPR
ncbi:hypothetical protein ACHMW6_25630 [Pseudoduganella sp. UC29_106]|uniref:hypothetical protein n=1 Tax=Pseudoduganella sp. UC29_106 TaxID=3374553 RepID=UPI003756EE14